MILHWDYWWITVNTLPWGICSSWVIKTKSFLSPATVYVAEKRKINILYDNNIQLYIIQLYKENQYIFYRLYKDRFQGNVLTETVCCLHRILEGIIFGT